MQQLKITIDEVCMKAEMVSRTIKKHLNGTPAVMYGIPRGGIPAAFAVAMCMPARITNNPAEANILIDDLIDSGATRDRYLAQYPKAAFFTLFDKTLPWINKKTWLVLPWEETESKDDSATDIVTRLLQYIGEDPTREGLKDTPERVLKAWKEWAIGYELDAGDILKTTFENGTTYDEMVIVHNVPVISKCEHHLADVIGHAHVGYIPTDKIVGLSKLARVVDMYARRLQVQERMTMQIADALMTHLDPLGVGVIVRANHGCMSTRGVKIHGSTTTTSAMRGALLEKPAAREEFINLCRMAERT